MAREVRAIGGKRDHLIMRLLAPRAAINGDVLAGIERCSHPVELRIVGANHGCGAVNGERGLVRCFGLRHVDRYDQHRDPAFRQRCLCRHRGHPPRLGRGADFLAENRPGRIDRLEINLLREVEAQLVAHDLARDEHDRRPVAIALPQAVDKVEAARPT